MQEEKMKKTKYMKKGGVLKRKGGGKATKYAAKGGALKRKGGGMTGYLQSSGRSSADINGGAMKKTKYMSKGGNLAGMARRRNAMRKM